MQLNELFTTEHDLKIEVDEPEALMIDAEVGRDKGQPQVYGFRAEHEDDNDVDRWSLEFGNYKDGYIDFKLTKEHNAIEVMSFVVQCIKFLIKKRKPNQMVFTARGPCRSAYKRMLQRLSGYEVNEHELSDNNVSYFEINRASA